MNADTVADARTLTRDLGRGQELYARARDHVERLRAVDHPGVCVPLDVTHRDDDRVIAALPALDGTDLASLRHLRGSLALGECIAVGIGVAEALSTLHAQGLVHGDISDANIMVVEGSIVLVDAWGEVLADERGTEPYASPERTSTGPSAPDDVYALGEVLRECVHPDGAERMAAWVAPMLDQDPQARPSASMVLRALPACGSPTGIDVPVAGVASAVRARAQGPHHETTRLASGRLWRVWTTGRRVLLVGAVAAAALVTLVIASRMVIAAAPMVLPAEPQPAQHARAADQPAVSAVALTVARFEALASGDTSALIQTTVPGSAAHSQAQQEAQALQRGDVSFAGLTVEVGEAETVAANNAHATVFLDYEVSPHQVRRGTQVVTYESYTQRVELDLTWTDRTWLVRQVQPLPSPTEPPT